MIYKSYLVEENLEILKKNIVLFYGENIGLIQEFRKRLHKKFPDEQILIFNQEDIINSSDNFYNELNNNSLFNDKKVFFINNVSDKFLSTIEKVAALNIKEKIFLFSDKLEKKSKIRNFFEKEKKTDIVPCYQDSDMTIKKIISKKLGNFKGITTEVINLISYSCGNDRARLNNEISKIIQFFKNQIIDVKHLSKLLNLKEEDNFNSIKDSVISGSKKATNNLLNSTIIEKEKSNLYLSMINQRLLILRSLLNEKQNVEKIINELRPPIFWKDKPVIIEQARKWNGERLDNAIAKTYQLELQLKTTSVINKNILFKKVLIDICNLANAA